MYGSSTVTYTVPAIKHYMGLDIPLWATPKYTPPDQRIITYKTGYMEIEETKKVVASDKGES